MLFMKRLISITVLLLLASCYTYSQNISDTLNRVDANGKKQGFWKKYVNDTLKYEGRFKNDKPVGTFTHYYGTGEVSSVVVFSKDGVFAKSVMYFPNGKKMAEGFYTNTKKDSIWLYYGANDTVISEEHYKNCKRNGVWKTFYKDGALNETRTWVSGVRQGPWKHYYNDGKIKMETQYINNKIEGLFKYYYPSGKVYLSGMYKNGLKEGVWMQFTEQQQGAVKETYQSGVLVKREELIKQPEEKMIPIPETEKEEVE